MTGSQLLLSAMCGPRPAWQRNHLNGMHTPIFGRIRTKPQEKRREAMKKKVTESKVSVYYFLGLGFEFVGILLFPAFVGYMVDTRLLSVTPKGGMWWTVGGILLGFGYGIWHLFRAASEATRRGIDTSSLPTFGSGKKKEDVGRKADSIHSGLDDVGRRLDDYIERSRNTKKQ